MPEIKEKKAVAELLFGVQAHKDNLFTAKVVKIRDGKVAEWKQGNTTSLGHALHIAEDLMGAYAIQAHEVTAERFYSDVVVI